MLQGMGEVGILELAVIVGGFGMDDGDDVL